MKLDRCITYAKVPARKLVYFILIIAGLHIQSSCTSQNITPDQFPDTDIIFQTTTLREDRTEDTLGFINANGSGLAFLSILIPNRWGGNSVPVMPIITGDGSTLMFRIQPMPYYPGELVLMRTGQQLLVCEVELGSHRPALTSHQEQVVIDLVNPGGRLAIYDPATCKEEFGKESGTIYNISAPDLSTHGALSPTNQILAIVKWQHEKGANAIFVLDLLGEQEMMIDYGFAPAWSPDGQRLAYTGADGLYIASVDGTDKRRVVDYQSPEGGGRPPFEEDWPPLPSWSPDGNWLVYHKCTLEPGLQTNCNTREDYAIFKVNIETGEEIKILDGGLNPYWRWQQDAP